MNETFYAAPGEHVAVVGRSGAGKSTLAHLLAGLVEPTQGSVTFDGRARHELARATLTRSVAYVEQFGPMLRGTIRDNLALWDPTIPDAVLLAAAKDAGVLADILAKPGGLDREVDVERPEWSGGQRQRLAIARALVKDPSLLILDEDLRRVQGGGGFRRDHCSPVVDSASRRSHCRPRWRSCRRARNS